MIDSSYLKDFLTTAWGTYRESQHYNLIKSALQINTSDIGWSVDSRFMALFSSVETLLLVYRLENDLEYIIKETKDWNCLRNQIKRLIKEHNSLKGDTNSRGLIYQNLNGINRIPLHLVIKEFFERKIVDLKDLWPFSTENNEYSLTKIRNRIVHGYGLNERYIESFGIALRNLDFYAKRILLVSLGWNFFNSRVFRREGKFVEEWKEAMEVMKDWDKHS